MNAKVRAIYRKELTDMLRDRRTIFATAIIPLLLYPLLTLGVVEVSLMAKAKLDSEEFPIAVLPGTKAQVELILKIARETPEPVKGLLAPETIPEKKHAPKKTVPIQTNSVQPAQTDIDDDDSDTVPSDTFTKTQFVFRDMSLADARSALADGTVRAVLILPLSFGADLSEQKQTQIAIEYDQAERVSQSAYTRLRSMLERYEFTVVKSRLKSQGVPGTFLHPFTLEATSTASPAKVGGSLLGGMLPLLFIVMLMTGALTPAIDMTAGEKERSTLETLVGARARLADRNHLRKISRRGHALIGHRRAERVEFRHFHRADAAAARAEMQFPWSALPADARAADSAGVIFSPR